MCSGRDPGDLVIAESLFSVLPPSLALSLGLVWVFVLM